MKIMCVYLMRIANYPKVYVGSTNNLGKRKDDHRCKLARDEHNNVFLQRVYNKYSKEDLVFEILEIVEDPKILRERELYWINFYDSANNKKGFNLIKNPISYERSKPLTKKQHKTALKAMEKAHAKTYILFDPQGKRVKIFNLAKFCRKKNLNYNAMISVILDRAPEYKGWKANLLRQNMAFKTYTFYDPKGVKTKITNLKKFCRENGLSHQGMWDVANGRFKNHKGWTLNDPKNIKIKIYKFKSPTGEIFECTNVVIFAKSQGLNSPMFYRLHNGKSVSYKKWTSADIVRKNKCFLQGKFLSPNGTIIEFENLSKLCKENGLSEGMMRYLLKGRVQEHRGWRLAAKNPKDCQLFSVV